MTPRIGSMLPRALSRRSLMFAFPAALLGSLLVAGVASADLLTPQSGADSRNADEIDNLYKLVLVIAVIVFIGVEGTLIWSLMRYKAKKGRVAAQIHGNTRLEVGWTVGAALILVLITVVTFIKLPDIKNPSGVGPKGLQLSSAAVYAATDLPTPPGVKSLNIKVDGQQYVWRYQYPGKDRVFAYEEMVVPEDTPVTLDISADDVAHSWWIPALGGKMDALPGYVNKTWFKAKPGVYPGQCAELCGRNHANMLARVRVVSVEEYQDWYDAQKTAIKDAFDGQAEQRAELEGEEGSTAVQGTGGGGSQEGGGEE